MHFLRELSLIPEVLSTCGQLWPGFELELVTLAATSTLAFPLLRGWIGKWLSGWRVVALPFHIRYRVQGNGQCLKLAEYRVE